LPPPENRSARPCFSAAYRGRLPYATDFRSNLLWGRKERPEDVDEWAHCDVGHREDIRDRLVPSFYFGCEGDDPMTALGARLNVLDSSDLGHFDLPDMRDAAKEAYELVERGLINGQDFRDFVFSNPVRAKTQLNPEFFKGTVVEDAVASLIAAPWAS
jgi:hypothetical protein